MAQFSDAQLDEMIPIAQAAIDANSNDHNQAARLDFLGALLGERYARRGTMPDLSRSIELARAATNVVPRHPNHVLHMSNLVASLSERYQALGITSDNDEAIRLAEAVIAATSPWDPNWPAYLNNLGSQLGHQYSRSGLTIHLDRWIAVLQRAVDAAADSSGIRDIASINLAVALGDRFQRQGELADLDKAIQISQIVASGTPLDHPQRARRLNTLANGLGERYASTKAVADLDEAIQIAEEAVAAVPDHHPERAAYLNNLSILLGDKWSRRGGSENLDRAIKLGRKSLELTPRDSLQRTGRLNNLAIRLRDRYVRTLTEAHEAKQGEVNPALIPMNDLSESIELLQRVVDETDISSPDRAQWLSNLSIPLANRYLHTESIKDLEVSIKATQDAVSAVPEDHPRRAAYLNNLGHRLGTRYNRTRAIGDLEKIVESYQSSLRQSNSSFFDRIVAGRQVIRYHAEGSQWQKAYEDSATAVGLIPRLTPKALSNSDKQHQIVWLVGLACDAAAAALNAGQPPLVALNLLEQGRGILATSLEEIRTDIVDLQIKHPELAKEFVRLRDILDGPATPEMIVQAENGQTDAGRRFAAGKELESHIAKIREHPGFENFLLPPSEADMKTAASSGPVVVINVSDYRCDALIIEQHTIRCLNLENLNSKLDEIIKNGAGSLGSLDTLDWLWDAVAEPILDALGITESPSDDKWPHVWWIPTGKLSMFPLHAAGHHAEGASETVLDRVMSSYSSSIRAIIQGRRRKSLATTAEDPGRALLVEMTETPGLPYGRLDSAAEEVESVQMLCMSMSYEVTTSTLRKADVVSHLPDCKIFHFAGHGFTDSVDPLKNSLGLKDWETDPLTIANLLEMNLRKHPPFLAYLSACGTGKVGDQKLFDESMHLISACQLAGFRHVIGTLWDVEDESSLYMAENTCQEMMKHGMTDEAVCLGLHNATRGLRDKQLHVSAREGQRDIASEGGLLFEQHTASTGERRSETSRGFNICNDDDAEEKIPYWVAYVHFGV